MTETVAAATWCIIAFIAWVIAVALMTRPSFAKTNLGKSLSNAFAALSRLLARR